MSTEQMTNEETPKKPRKGSRAEEDATVEPPAEVSGPAAETPAAEPVKAVTWNDVVAASAERDANEWEWEISEEVIDIKLTATDGYELLRANGADEETKSAVDREIDAMKASLKEKKAESDAISARMKERNRSGARGVQSKKAHWKVGTCFALNTVRYIDPITDRIVHERPIEAHERQVSLPLVSEQSAQKAAQLSLGDNDPADLTDPEALLKAALEGEAPPADDAGDDDHYDDADEDDDDADEDAEP